MSKQERRIDQLKKEKEQLQEQLTHTDQETDVRRLTEAIKRKDDQLKELSAALTSIRRVVEGVKQQPGGKWDS